MRVLGISGRPRQGAAAIAVDGRITAAVTDVSVARPAGSGEADASALPFAAIRACLAHASLAPDDIDLVVVEGLDERDLDDTRARWSARTDPSLRDLAGRTHLAVDTLTARAAQALLVGGGSHTRIAVLDLDGVTGGGTFESNGGLLSPLQAIDGVHHLSSAIADVARALGVRPHLSSLDALAERGQLEFLPALRQALTYRAFAVDLSTPALAATIAEAVAAAPGALSDPSPIHVPPPRRDAE